MLKKVPISLFTYVIIQSSKEKSPSVQASRLPPTVAHFSFCDYRAAYVECVAIQRDRKKSRHHRYMTYYSTT